jgi:LmbE family N-acetylglucosaminyl deacetylase
VWTLIVSLVGDEVWADRLHDVEAWVPERRRILFVAPHPDDETLGAGGLIATQRRLEVEVTVVCVTDGENAYPDADDCAELARVRRGEQELALQHLGVAPAGTVRLGFEDSAVSSREAELAERLAELAGPGGMIVAPWEGDFHPDHEACGRAASRAAKRVGAQLISYFFWTWHRGTPECLGNLRLVKYALDDESLRAKAEALVAHESQLWRAGAEAILPQRLLGPARWPYEVFALR